MQYGRNTVAVYYKIRNGESKAKLELAPIFNFRDFHTMNTNHNFDIAQEMKDDKVKIVIDKNIENPIYMKISEGKYIQHLNNTFYNTHLHMIWPNYPHDYGNHQHNPD